QPPFLWSRRNARFSRLFGLSRHGIGVPDVESFSLSNRIPIRPLAMEMDTKDALEYLQAALRSVGAEVTSPWFYFQVGVVLAGAGIAFASGAAIRARVDINKLGANWPAPFRMIVRVLVLHSSTAVAALLDRRVRLPDAGVPYHHESFDL